jgi:hypothetical protein
MTTAVQTQTSDMMPAVLLHAIDLETLDNERTITLPAQIHATIAKPHQDHPKDATDHLPATIVLPIVHTMTSLLPTSHVVTGAVLLIVDRQSLHPSTMIAQLWTLFVLLMDASLLAWRPSTTTRS